ncbi:BTB/POZ domain-containing protein KCTD19 [Discoglossus pictus]
MEKRTECAMKNSFQYNHESFSGMLRLAAQGTTLLTAARRAIWLKACKADLASKNRLLGMPFECSYLFGPEWDALSEKLLERKPKLLQDRHVLIFYAGIEHFKEMEFTDFLAFFNHRGFCISLLNYIRTKEVGDQSAEFTDADLFHFNIGGWLFSIPKKKLAQYQESLLWREASALSMTANSKLFIDRDGLVFKHIHYFLHTSKLSFTSCSDLDLLYEQALSLQLKPLLQTLDNLREGKHHLRARPGTDIPVSKRASMNYWKTRKCNSKLSEFPVKSPVLTGFQDKAPLGLIDTPLLDVDEEVHYCFLPVEVLQKYPALVTEDNLLWISENVALIECDYSEVCMMGKTCSSSTESLMYSMTNNQMLHKGLKPLYAMALGLLAKYPDSVLGQLHVESSVDGSKLFIAGNGTLFQHVRNWLGTCRLPLTNNFFEIYGLCTYLDKEDILYQPMKDALRSYLNSRTCTRSGKRGDYWKADVREYLIHQIVKIYVGNHWYATYLKTLLKYPEFLLNYKKVSWITCGFSLLVRGDGQMFRHVLNFLRLDSLLLPSEFKEWSLFSQEVIEFQIPSLLEALHECVAYRSWINEYKPPFTVPPPMDCPDQTAQKKKCEESNGSFFKGRRKIESSVNQQYTNSETEKYNRTFKRFSCSKSGTSPPDQDSALNCSYFDFVIPPYKVIKKDQTGINENETSVSSPMLKLISLVKQLNEINCKATTCNQPDTNQDGADTKQQKMCPTLGKDTMEYEWHPLASDVDMSAGHNNQSNILKPEKEDMARREFKESISIELSELKAEEFSDLGTILWIEHDPLVASDGSAASFEDSIVYTTEFDSLMSARGKKEMQTDLVFFSFNMSYEEIFYARKCHCFLTGIILDSMQHDDPKPNILSLLHLVNGLWAFQISSKQFVDDLLAMDYYKNDKCIKEMLMRWVELTLPYARKYSQCAILMLQRGLHKTATCSVLRNNLQQH